MPDVKLDELWLRGILRRSICLCVSFFLFQAGKGEPPSLPIGTDVSAKYKGAFCEAKVKKVAKQVKVKVCSSPFACDGPLSVGDQWDLVCLFSAGQSARWTWSTCGHGWRYYWTSQGLSSCHNGLTKHCVLFREISHFRSSGHAGCDYIWFCSLDGTYFTIFLFPLNMHGQLAEWPASAVL